MRNIFKMRFTKKKLEDKITFIERNLYVVIGMMYLKKQVD